MSLCVTDLGNLRRGWDGQAEKAGLRACFYRSGPASKTSAAGGQSRPQRLLIKCQHPAATHSAITEPRAATVAGSDTFAAVKS